VPVLAAARELVAAAGVAGMVGGQYLDITGDVEADGEALRELHALKTGRLIGASVECVLLLRGLDDDATAPYRRFARELGVLFQIVDDILDVAGDERATGKPSGSDERLGKATYVSVFGMRRARELAGESHARARAALAEAPGETAKLARVADYILTRPR
jgi:geranylgeranyl diphosphate synthase type II